MIRRDGLSRRSTDHTCFSAVAMIEHLYEQGHRRIKILAGPEGNYDSDQRLLGCRGACERDLHGSNLQVRRESSGADFSNDSSSTRMCAMMPC